jgi:hypothetical protein
MPLPGVVTVDVDGRACVYSPLRNEVLFLNQSASDIWWLLDGELDVAGLVATLALAHGVDPAALVADVQRALSTFADAGLIERPDSP